MQKSLQTLIRELDFEEFELLLEKVKAKFTDPDDFEMASCILEMGLTPYLAAKEVIGSGATERSFSTLYQRTPPIVAMIHEYCGINLPELIKEFVNTGELYCSADLAPAIIKGAKAMGLNFSREAALIVVGEQYA